MAGVYIHIPFCGSFCVYCGFYSELCHGTDVVDRYISCLKREIEYKKNFFGGVLPSTIYFGGGTPSLLSPDRLDIVLSSVRETFFRKAAPVETTIEVNPDDISPEYAAALRSLGFDRVSMGVQSFNDRNLSWMGRRHNGNEAVKAYRILRDAGFRNISMDLIFGYALSEDSWEDDVERMIGLHPEHVSAYQLSIEPDSALERSGYREMPQENCRRQYDLICDRLASAGYEHYEISNFALPGNESRHNSAYWVHEPYLGLGASAHSYGGDGYGVRSWNPADIKAYVTDGSFRGESEILTRENYIDETVMLGLRKMSGIDSGDLRRLLSDAEFSRFMKSVDRFVAQGMLMKKGQMISLTPSSYFISDYIISEICSVF